MQTMGAVRGLRSGLACVNYKKNGLGQCSIEREARHG